MRIRILIIDNEPRWIEFVKRDLDVFEIVVAHSTDEALDELRKDMFALVIASAKNLDALQIIAEKFSDKRVVVTTIHPSTDEALHAYRLGAIRYFPKSFSQKDLLKKVNDVIPQSRLSASPF